MLDRIPKPVLFVAVSVILLLAVVVIFKSAKSAGGAGDYNADEIRRLASERNNKPNGGRATPIMSPTATGGAHPGLSSSTGSPMSSGGR